MNVFQLILKQMRQRALSTVLTVVSIALGVGLAIAILVLQREGRNVFGQSDYGYEVIVGVKGSGLQLVVNTVYRIDQSPGNVPFAVYEKLTKDKLFRRDVRHAIPQCVGDSYQGQPIVGTVPQYFGYDDAGKRIENTPDNPDARFCYRLGESFEMASGRVMNASKFEAVLGSDVTKATGLKLGDVFQATHGFPQPGQTPDVHDEKWTVVGVLAPTRTAADKCVYIGLTSFYTIFEHGEGELDRAAAREGKDANTRQREATTRKAAEAERKDDHDHDHDHKDATGGHDHADHAGHDHDEDEEKHYTLAPDGTITLNADVLAAREVSAVLVHTRGGGSGLNALNLIFNLNLQPDVMAVNPATVMRSFFDNFLSGPITLLLVISVLVTVIAAVGILTTIYNSVSARTREIAVLRALGATRAKVLVLISVEAVLLGVLGGVIGFALGHAVCGVGNAYLYRTLGQSIGWARVSPGEIYYVIGVAALSFVAGLVPALKAYRVPVATNLVAQ